MKKEKLLVVIVFLFLAFSDHQSAFIQAGQGFPILWAPDSSFLLIGKPGREIKAGEKVQLLQEIYAFYPDTESYRKISENAFFPYFSPDGQKLSFTSFLGPGEALLQEMNLKTRRVTATARASWPTGPREAISPDGRYAISKKDSAIYLKDFSLKREFLLFQARYAGGVSWTPDSLKAALIASPEPFKSQLWLVTTSPPGARMLLELEGEVLDGPSIYPDGSFVAFGRCPLGAGTIEMFDIWAIEVNGENLRPLVEGPGEDSSPLFSPNGRFLAFRHGGEVLVVEFEKSMGKIVPPRRPSILSVSALAEAYPPLLPPSTIRVIHNPNNYYRSDVPPWQIDVFDFETYVKQVVPYEMPALWHMEALKAQAVAARTYGWFFIIKNRSLNYDVSDWVDYQVMGPSTHERSNQATDGTRGQYIEWKGQPILAEYSAENSSPTLPRYKPGTYEPDPNYPYLSSVYDPVGFGQPRRGHGRGMSQYGAKRWAENYGWGYQQILTHYYTGVNIRKALASSDTGPPLASITKPWSRFYLNTNWILLQANASDEFSGISAVEFYSGTGLLITDTEGVDGWSYLWDVSSLPDTGLSEGIDLWVRAFDGQGNGSSAERPVRARIGIDRVEPRATVSINSPFVTSLDITLTVTVSDTAPGEVGGVGISNGWLWEERDFYTQTGRIVNDPDALDGKALQAKARTDPPGAWYGPYTFALEPGFPYRAIFRLKVSNPITPTEEVAVLDVVQDAGTKILGIRRLRGIDFKAPDVYQEFPVDFYYWTKGSAGLEFRLAFKSTADIYLDRVLVTSYPSPAGEVPWRLTYGEGEKLLWIKAFDRAGNVSSDIILTLIVDFNPPSGWSELIPSGWLSQSPPITLAVQVTDDVSGLDPETGAFRYSVDEGVTWSDWLTASVTLINPLRGMVVAPMVPVPQGTAGRIQFRIADRAGLSSESPIYVTRVYWQTFLPLILKQ
ncbi:MAG: SpoIID/LytB domain-containing protein [Anaerolineae bacterium]|nr:SpoIID/LytB domain-containing protein [Anaerolineae bacterium]